MTHKNFLIVYNPQTGTKGLHALNELIDNLVERRFGYDIYYTKINSLETEKQINEKIDSYSDIVSIGGDGTLNMLSNALAFKNIPLGILPCGTGNDFARHIYKKSDNILATVIDGTAKKVDLGWCNGRYFMNVLGIGYDSMIAEETKNDHKVFLRSFFYLWNALKYLPFYKEHQIHIKGKEFDKKEATFMAAFGNGRFFGSGMKITPNADISDGLLEFCWVGKLAFIKKCQCVLKIFSGTHIDEKNIEYTQGTEFHILTEQLPIEADGEFVGYTPATIRIVEHALMLKIPDTR
jgi:YegS/Rv2252/BmrU family lipid kinase